MNRYLISSTLILLLLAGWNTTQGQSERTIEGVWRVSQIENDNESEPNTNPLSSQMIFTKTHYSMVWSQGNSAMRAFNKRWAPTNDEILKRFWEITVNSGTYKIDGNRIRTEPKIARFPEFMGGHMIYDFRWSGDNIVLTLIDEYTFDGVQAPWVASRGGQRHVTLTPVTD